jgi:hypothetical protein
MLTEKELSREVEQARHIYSEIASQVEQENLGKIIGIHLPTKRYFIGETELVAYDEAARELKERVRLVFLRVGSSFTHYIGCGCRQAPR